MSVHFLPLFELSWVFFPFIWVFFVLSSPLLRMQQREETCRDVRTGGQIPFVPQSPQRLSVR